MSGLFTFLLLAFFFFLGYLLYRNNKKKNKEAFFKKSENTGSEKTDDWVFNKDINEENVPKLLLSYRRRLNGYTSEKINTLYEEFVTKGIPHETQKNLAILGLTEAVIELEMNISDKVYT